MNKLPKQDDYLKVQSGYVIVKNLKVIDIEKRENICDSIITVEGKYGRRYKEPLWMFSPEI